MRGFLLGILIFLLCSAVLIGAANTVFNTNNRPYTLYEFVQEVSSLDFGLDNITSMINNLERIWGNTRAHGNAIGGTLNFVDTSGYAIVDFLSAIYNVFLSLYEVVSFVFNFVFDISKFLVQLLQLFLNFIIGKPVAA